MKEYHKIQTIFKRDPETNYKTLLLGQYSLPEFEYLANNEWVFTEKVDGTNIRIGLENGKLVIGGRTNNAQIPTFLLGTLTDLFTPEKLVDVFSDEDFCLYGEGYGAKIQKGGENYKPDGTGFVLFDIRVGDWWLQRKDVREIANTLNLKVVPIVGYGPLDDAIEMVQRGITSDWGNFIAEGIVVRLNIELKARNGKRIITKIKTKDFKQEDK